MGLAAVVMVTATALMLDLDIPVLRPILGLTLLMVVPIIVLTSRVCWRDQSGAYILVVSSGITLLGIILVGLSVNTFLPTFGFSHPLSLPVLVVTATVADLLLILWRPAIPLTTMRLVAAWVRGLPSSRWRLSTAAATLTLLTSIAGALRLNNGAPSSVAVAGHVLAALTLAILMFGKRGSINTDALAIYLVSLGMLLATSLRGWYIIGHDIQREYVAYLLTQEGDRWQMSELNSAYNACLSINLTPTILSNLAGVSGPIAFKLLLQFVFAAVPVIVYLSAHSMFARRIAVLSAIVFICFPTFYNDMPFLVRQEVAFFFLGLVVLMASDDRAPRPRRQALAIFFGVGVVLSHYSTTYVMLLGFVFAALGLYGPKLAAGVLQRSSARYQHAPPRAKPLLLHPLTLSVLVAATWLWVTPITNSGGHLADTIAETVSSVLHHDESGPDSSDLAYGLFAGKQKSPRERLDLYAEQIQRDRLGQSREWLLASPRGDTLHPPIVSDERLPLTALGRGLASAGVEPNKLNSGLRMGSALVIQLLLLLGATAIALRRRLYPGLGAEARWLMFGSLAGLVLLVALPGLSVEYGILRAFQQCLLFSAPIVALGGVLAFRFLGEKAAFTAGVLMLTILVCLSGVVSTVTGGHQGLLALSNSGQYYNLYYLRDSEVSGIRWLARAAGGEPVHSEVIEDKVTMNRVQSRPAGPVPASEGFFPAQLKRHRYVFLSHDTVMKGQATVFFTGNLLTYRYPTWVVQKRLNLVFSAPSTQVYR